MVTGANLNWLIIYSPRDEKWAQIQKYPNNTTHVYLSLSGANIKKDTFNHEVKSGFDALIMWEHSGAFKVFTWGSSSRKEREADFFFIHAGT